MAKVEQCPGFETFGADVKTAREKVGISRRELAEKIGVDPRYLANIELNATIPSMPLVVQLFHLCRLPAEKYFNPEQRKQETEQYQRVKYKVQLCPEKYLPAMCGCAAASPLAYAVCSYGLSHAASTFPARWASLRSTSLWAA